MESDFQKEAMYEGPRPLKRLVSYPSFFRIHMIWGNSEKKSFCALMLPYMKRIRYCANSPFMSIILHLRIKVHLGWANNSIFFLFCLKSKCPIIHLSQRAFKSYFVKICCLHTNSLFSFLIAPHAFLIKYRIGLNLPTGVFIMWETLLFWPWLCWIKNTYLSHSWIHPLIRSLLSANQKCYSLQISSTSCETGPSSITPN